MSRNRYTISPSYFGRALLEKITRTLGGGTTKWLLPLTLMVGGCGVAEPEPEANLPDVSLPSVGAPDLDAINIPGLPPGMKDTVGGAIFDKLSSSLGGVTDVASAKAAIPELNNVSSTMSDLAGALEPEAKGPTGKLVSMFLPQLDHQIETVKSIPGVGDILNDILGQILTKAKGLAG